MARVEIKPARGGRKAFAKVMKSDALAEQLEPLGSAVLRAASNDPNPEYVESLRKRRFVSRGDAGRVSIQVGAAPGLGDRVEAKRGTLARAMGEAGLK